MSGTMKKFTKKLPCTINNDEYAALSKELVEWLTDINRREFKIQLVKEEHKLPLKQATEKVEELRATLAHKTVAREVECVQVYNWDTKNTHVVRLDTNELVPGSVRPMTEDEMQADLTQEEAPVELLLQLEGPTEGKPVEAKKVVTEDDDFEVVDEEESKTNELDFDSSDEDDEDSEEVDFDGELLEEEVAE